MKLQITNGGLLALACAIEELFPAIPLQDTTFTLNDTQVRNTVLKTITDMSDEDLQDFVQLVLNLSHGIEGEITLTNPKG